PGTRAEAVRGPRFIGWGIATKSASLCFLVFWQDLTPRTFPSSARATTYLSNQQGEIVKSDKSPFQIRNFEIADWTRLSEVKSEISDLGFEMQDSSDFKIPSHRCLVSQVC